MYMYDYNVYVCLQCIMYMYAYNVHMHNMYDYIV